MYTFLDIIIRLLTLIALQVRIVYKSTRKIVLYLYKSLDEIMRLQIIQHNLETKCDQTIGE